MGLEQNIENNLYELFAKDINNARDGEFFTALAYSIKQIIGKQWFKTLKSNINKKRLYILSFEYSFGDKLIKNLIKLNLLEEIKQIVKKHNKNFENIKAHDIDFALGFSELGDVTTELIEQLATYNQNVYSYGLRYRRGMLKQEIVDGKQVEKPDDWQVNKNPWEHEKAFSHIVDFKDFSVKAIPYDLPIISDDGNYINTLRLWKSFSIKNIDFEKFSNGDILNSYNDINRANSIVEFLYPNENNFEGKKLRFIQEYFFASSCIQDIFKKYKKYQDDDIRNIYKHNLIQINDAHPIISILTFIEILTKKYEVDFNEAILIAKKTFVFLHLSLLPETFEKWDLSLIEQVAPNLIETINKLDNYIRNDLLNKNISKSFQLICNGQLNLINLAFYICKDILTLNIAYCDILKNKYSFYNEYYFSKIKFIDFASDTLQYLKEINIENEKIYANHKYFDKNNYLMIKENAKKLVLDYINYDKNLINTKAPFVMHLGIFHESKRQLLSVLGIALQYYRLKNNPNLDIPERIYIYSGKSYPNYYVAKETIALINALARLINNDLFIKDKIKIIFIENYNQTRERILLPASDIFLKLDLLDLEKNKSIIERAITSNSAIISTNSSFKTNRMMEKGVKTYTFGNSAKEDLFNDNSYKFFDYLSNNKEINDMFDFYRNLKNTNFSYDINKIFNSIYYFNDTFEIIKDLYDYVDVLEKSIKDYTFIDKWISVILENAEKTKNRKPKENIRNYIELIGGLND